MEPLIQRKIKCIECGTLNSKLIKFKAVCGAIVCIAHEDRHVNTCKECLKYTLDKKGSKSYCKEII